MYKKKMKIPALFMWQNWEDWISEHLLYASHYSINALYILIHLLLTTAPWHRHYYYSYEGGKLWRSESGKEKLNNTGICASK